LQDDTKMVDVIEIYWLIPIMLLLPPFVLLYSGKLFDKANVLGIDPWKPWMRNLNPYRGKRSAYKKKKRIKLP